MRMFAVSFVVGGRRRCWERFALNALMARANAERALKAEYGSAWSDLSVA